MTTHITPATPATPAPQNAPDPSGSEASPPPVPDNGPDTLTDLARNFVRELGNLTSEWALYQFLIILSAMLVALVIARTITPPLEARIRGISGQPRLLRLLAILLRRLRWIIFAGILWGAWAIMQYATIWQSRSFYILLAANLATAWVVISVLSRLIRNRSLAKIFAVIAWSLFALHLLGLLTPISNLLDSAAYSAGSARISLLLITKAAVLLTVLIWAASILGDFLDRRVKRDLELAPSLQVLIGKLIKAVLFVTAVLVSMSAVGLDLTALTVFSGGLGLGIGFGLQKVASNLVSGIIILMDKSIKPGDVISLNETFGWISSLKGRYVSVVTRDGVEYLIPNEDFVTEKVVNWSYSNRNIRLDVHFGVSYDCDPHSVRKLACEALAPIERIMKRPAPVCHVVGFGDSSIDFVLRFWISDPETGLTNIRGAAYLALWDAFKENDIEIPYPHRQILLPQDQATDAPAKRSGL